MSSTPEDEMKKILDKLLALPEDQRLKIAGALLDSAPFRPPSAYLSEDEKAFIDQRIAASDANPDGGVTAEESLAEARAEIEKVTKE